MASQDTSTSPPCEQTSEASSHPPRAPGISAETEPSSSTDGVGPRSTTAEVLKSPTERLRESGDGLRAQIERSPKIAVTLQQSASAFANCRARSNCSYKLAGNRCGNRITTPYRICVKGLKGWGNTSFYYHVQCFSQMKNVRTMIHDGRFKLQDRCWGLMFRKWYESLGHVDLDKLESYIEAHKAYEKVKQEVDAEQLNWQRQHNSVCKEGETCACPPKPDFPEKPVLRDYKTPEGRVCELSDVVEHKNS
ncbi:hypothetical protein diail_1700, partial [Diaporthe ilicicola]